MVAVIKTGNDIHRILNYNENKVKKSVAECILAQNYPMDAGLLSFNHKLNRFLMQASLNENVTSNSVHISINFDPSEQLSNETLQEIADSYMNKIGFGEQPYLVYRHYDAGHPHMHIVSIKVRADGSRIDMHNIGRNQSEKARKEIEVQYGLVKAQGRGETVQHDIKSAYAAKIQYGKSESRKAITLVLEAVLNAYKYASLPELNAVLKQYNVWADRGTDGSRVYQHQGLLYHILDESGNPIGVPIKASSFYNKPTLKTLETKFKANEIARQPHKVRTKNVIDAALLKQPGMPLKALMEVLMKDGINTVLRQNEQGVIYGLTYVDHKTKCVFNGSELGKQYSAKGLLERCERGPIQPLQRQYSIDKPDGDTISIGEFLELYKPQSIQDSIALLDVLLRPEFTPTFGYNELMRKGRRKRRKRNNKRL